MSPARFQELVEAVLSGRAGEADRDELADRIEHDPELRAEFLRRSEITHLLPLALEEKKDAERFLESIRARLQAKGDSQAFLAATRQRILRAGARPSRPRAGWVAAGIAAAALVAAALWVYVGSDATPLPPPNKEVVKQKVPPASQAEPPAPVPKPTIEEPETDPVVAPPAPPKTEPKSVPKLVPVPKPAPPPPVIVRKPEPAPEPPAPVASPYFATIEKIDGDVTVLSGPLKKPAKAGKQIFRRRGLQTGGAKSGAVVRYSDGTQLELAPNTVVWDVSDRPTSSEEPAKRILVAQGEVLASVSAQPAARPMVLVTPHGEAEVLGTIFRLQVEGESTRLDMGKGRVRLTRKDDRKSVDVTAGFTATIAPGQPFLAIPRRSAFSGTPSGSKTNR